MIMGNRGGFHLTERTIMTIWKGLNLFFRRRASRYTGVEVKILARAMCNAANHPSEKVMIYHWKEMNDVLFQKNEY